jgi:hypothetical protein
MSNVRPHNMPYALTFQLEAHVPDSDKYINDCCIGGDLVLDQLEPILRTQYEEVQANQEDWGWFAWTEQNGVRLAVDIFNDDPKTMSFTVHITGRKARWVLPDKVEDTAELEVLKNTVVNAVRALPVRELKVEQVDGKYLPLSGVA